MRTFFFAPWLHISVFVCSRHSLALSSLHRTCHQSSSLQDFDGIGLAQYEDSKADVNNVLATTVSSVLGGLVTSKDVVFDPVSRRRLKERLAAGASHNSDNKVHSSENSKVVTTAATTTTTAASDSTSTTSNTHRVRHTADDDVSVIAEEVSSVNTSSLSLSYIVKFPPTLTYASLSGQLISSVSDGLFTETMHKTAAATGVSVMESWETTFISTSQGSATPTSEPTTAPTTYVPTSEPSLSPTYSAGSPTPEPTAEPTA